MSFSGDIKKFNTKTEKNINNVFRGTALSLFSKVILRTPVGNPSTWENPGLWRSLGFSGKGYTGGRLRANWQAQINSIPSGEVDKTDESGSSTISSASAIINKVKNGDSIFFVNNLPYAEPTENGRSKQAPFGMVRITIAEYKYELSKQARKHNK